jgi:adenylate cyclase
MANANLFGKIPDLLRGPSQLRSVVQGPESRKHGPIRGSGREPDEGRCAVPGRISSPLDWSTPAKVLFGSVQLLFYNLWFFAAVTYALRHPEVAPYLHRDVLALTFRLQLGLLAGWTVLAGLSVWERRRAAGSRALVQVALHLGVLNICIGGYLTGFFFSPIAGVSGLAAVAVVFILFDKRAVVPSLVSLIALATTFTVAEMVGAIRSAPLLAAAPFSAGRLSRWWLVGVGGPTFVVFVGTIGMIHLMVERWRERETRLAVTSEELAKANELISRYVVPQVSKHILAGDYDVIEKRDRRKLTLFFSDIEGFTETADEVEPEDLSRALDEYLSEMTSIAERHGATIDKFVGDAIMIFFGAPDATTDQDHALRAVRMALEMQERMSELRRRWSAVGFDRPFAIRIGINTGMASVGNFGARGRVDYTAIGRQVNLAARLQAACRPGRVLLSRPTWMLVRDQIPCVPKGEIELRGIHHPVQVYEAFPPVRSQSAAEFVES